MPQTANPHNKSKNNTKMPAWNGKLTHTSWKEGGKEDRYFRSLVETGVLTGATKWSEIKKREDAHPALSAFDCDTLRNKFKKYKGIAKANEERSKAVSGKIVAVFSLLLLTWLLTMRAIRRPYSEQGEDLPYDPNEVEEVEEEEEEMARLLSREPQVAHPIGANRVEHSDMHDPRKCHDDPNDIGNYFDFEMPRLPWKVYQDPVELVTRIQTRFLPISGAEDPEEWKMELINEGKQLQIVINCPEGLTEAGLIANSTDVFGNTESYVAAKLAAKEHLNEVSLTHERGGYFYLRCVIDLPEPMEKIEITQHWQMLGDVVLVQLKGPKSAFAISMEKKQRKTLKLNYQPPAGDSVLNDITQSTVKRLKRYF